MRWHAACVARDGEGVIILGPSGAGKSDLALRLIDRGFMLVADDQVLVDRGIARPVPALSGLLEMRGLGLIRLPFLPEARLALAVTLTAPGQLPDRLPVPTRHAGLDLPHVRLAAAPVSAAIAVALALDCATGRAVQAVGAFAA